MLQFFKQLAWFFLFLLFFVFLLLGWQYRALFVSPMFTNAAPRIFEMKAGMSANGFVQSLYDEKLISKKQLLLRFIQYHSLSGRLKTGVYQVFPNETVVHLVYRIVAGDVLVQYFRVIEGTTEKQIHETIEKAPYLVKDVHDWEVVRGDQTVSEGLLLPETYQYDAGSRARDLLLTMHRALSVLLDEVWRTRDPDLPYKTPYELLIAASIIEKESDKTNERPLISAVIVNRLKKGMPLQMDPTVIYALGHSYTGKLVHEDMKIDSPYNTYRYKGLPPTPICMPGKEAIKAAANPSKASYLYFVAKGDGTHVFSNTWAEHQKAVQAYWRLMKGAL